MVLMPVLLLLLRELLLGMLLTFRALGQLADAVGQYAKVLLSSKRLSGQVGAGRHIPALDEVVHDVGVIEGGVHPRPLGNL